MATLSPRRFTNYATLTAIRADLLLKLLHPYKDYFASRDVRLPEEARNGRAIPYQAIGKVLMTPDTATPPDLIEALYYIHEMASRACYEAMIEALDQTAITIQDPESATALDLAVQIWMKDRCMLEQLHDEQNLVRPRSFDYFRTNQEKRFDFKPPDSGAVQAMEADLDCWFMSKGRGRSARIHVFGRPESAWFLVRHGAPFKHENALRDGESTCITFQPEQFDVIAYDSTTGQIRINARTKGERELYRTIFGRHLFGSDCFFGEQSHFTLEPLRRDGRAALVCQDVRGMEHVILKEVQLSWGGHHNEEEIRRADDVFAAIENRRVRFPKEPRLTRATFAIKFTDAKAERTVTICSTNRAYYKRDDDAGILESWMRRRGFIVFGDVPCARDCGNVSNDNRACPPFWLNGN